MSRIQSQLADLHRQMRKTLLARGLSWTLIATLGGLFCAGFLDWWLHVPGLLRLLFGVAIVAASGWTIWRRLLLPLLRAVSDVDLALKIERRFPSFRDSLASTVQFEKAQADPRLGSPQLQRKVIRQTEAKLQKTDLQDVIETRAVQHTAIAALCLSLFVVTVCGLNRADANRAFYRLKYPFSEDAKAKWPQKTRLQIFDDDLRAIVAEPPLQRVRGETLNLYVENVKGDLPKDAVLEVKTPDGEVVSEKLQRVTMSDGRNTERKLGVASLLLDVGPLKFRAVGGDDRKQKWRTVQVIPAPRIGLLQVTLIPPKYVSEKEKSLPKGVGRIRQAWVGTTVRIEAKANTPLKSVHLHFLHDETKTVQLKLAGDQKSFTTTFFLSKPGELKYWFDLKDLKGFSNPRAPRYTVHTVEDRVPRIRLIRPVNNLRATPNAVLPIKVEIAEDIRLKNVEIRYRQSGAESRPTKTRPAKSIPIRNPEAEYLWRIPGVVAGTQLRFHIRATDHFNLDSDGKVSRSIKTRHVRDPDVGKTDSLTIFIVSPHDKLAEISQASGLLLSELRRIEKLQRKAQERVESLLMQLQKVGRLRPREDLPLLRRLAADQGDISDRLVKEGGVVTVAKQLVRDLSNNRLLTGKERKNRIAIQATAVKRRLQRIIGELEDLEQQYLRLVEADLTIAWKGADPAVLKERQTGAKKPSLNAQEQISQLEIAQSRQVMILATLQELISGLSQWRDWKNLLHDVLDLIQTQENIRRRSRVFNAAIEGVPFQKLKDQQKANLMRLAEEQRRMKDRLDQFQGDLSRFRKERQKSAADDDPVLSLLTRVLGYLRLQKLTDSMDEIAGMIDANHLNESLDVQTRILSELHEVQAILRDKETSDLQTLIQQQKLAERQLAQFAQRQQRLTHLVAALNDRVDPARRREELQKLVARQKTLQKKASRWQSRLKHLHAAAAGNSLRRSARRMDEASRLLQRDEIPLTQLRQQQAADEIAQGRRELARTRAGAEAQLARELLERIADQLRGIIGRQQKIITGSEQLQREIARTGRWTRERQMTLDTLHDEQQQLQRQLDELAEKTKAAEVFAHVLRTASFRAEQTADSLQRGRSSSGQLEKAIERGQSTRKLLLELLASLSSPKPSRTLPNSTPSPPGAGTNRKPRTNGIPGFTQWKLLRTAQTDLRQRTIEIEKQRPPSSSPPAAILAQIEQLADAQGQLADLANRLAIGRIRPADNVSGKPPSITKSSETKSSETQPSRTQSSRTIRQGTATESGIKTGRTKSAESIPSLAKRVATGMRTAADQLDQHKTGEATVRLQKRILDDLDKLIVLAERLHASFGTKAGSATVETGTPSPGTSQPHGKTTSTQPARTRNQPDTKKPRGSSSDVRNPRNLQKRLQHAARREMIQEIWGHLPKSARQKLQNSLDGGSFLPNFKQHISDYFESLAK